MHKAGKATASHSVCDPVGGRGRLGRRIAVRWPRTLVFARLGGGRDRRSRVIGLYSGARQVERGTSERVVDCEVCVRVRRLWRRATECPDDVLYAVWRSLRSEEMKRSEVRNRTLGRPNATPLNNDKLTGRVNAICRCSPVT